jgi:hypothetical protein
MSKRVIGTGLRSYRNHRLELGDMLRAALHLARSSGDHGCFRCARGGPLGPAACRRGQEWLRRKAGEVNELLTGLAGSEIGVLLEASRSPRAIGARLAGLTEDDDQGEPAGWSAEDIPDLALCPGPIRTPRKRRVARRDPLPRACQEADLRSVRYDRRTALQRVSLRWATRWGQVASSSGRAVLFCW